METRVLWDETKRQANLRKHGLDFLDAVMVLESPYRLDIQSVRCGEKRTQSFAYVFDLLAVLTVVHSPRGSALRIVSFRTASQERGAPTMAGSKVTTTTPDEMRAAIQRGESRTDLKKVRAQTPYVWDGENEDDRPLTTQGMGAGIAANHRRRGRPAGSRKTSTTIRLDREIVAAFRASGPGWQTRMNAALRDWLKTHSTD